jgi:multiple sugar transport system substrate-binding protein
MHPTVTRSAGKILALLALLTLGGWAQAQVQSLSVTAYPAVDKIIEAAIPLWKKKHPDVEIKLVSRSMEDHHKAMSTALSTSSNLPDVMALEFGYLGRFAAGGGFEDLSQPPYRIRDVQSRFVPFAFKQATTSTGAVLAAPTDIGPGTLLYRVDLLKKAGVTEGELTQSWDSFVASGVKIKAATGAYLVAHARDIKEIMIRSNVKPGEGLYFDPAGKVLVDSPRFVRAFELSRKVRQQKLDGRIGGWSTEWSQGFKNGTIATQMSGAWLSAQMASWIAPTTKGLWRASQLPEKSWSAWGGTFYAIPKAAKNKALAWEFIQLMTLSREAQLSAFKVQDAFPALLEAQTDPFFDQPIEFLGGQKARLLWREAALKVNAIDVNKLDPIADEIINTELDKGHSHGAGRRQGADRTARAPLSSPRY